MFVKKVLEGLFFESEQDRGLSALHSDPASHGFIFYNLHLAEVHSWGDVLKDFHDILGSL